MPQEYYFSFDISKISNTYSLEFKMERGIGYDFSFYPYQIWLAKIERTHILGIRQNDHKIRIDKLLTSKRDNTNEFIINSLKSSIKPGANGKLSQLFLAHIDVKQSILNHITLAKIDQPKHKVLFSSLLIGDHDNHNESFKNTTMQTTLKTKGNAIESSHNILSLRQQTIHSGDLDSNINASKFHDEYRSNLNTTIKLDRMNDYSDCKELISWEATRSKQHNARTENNKLSFRISQHNSQIEHQESMTRINVNKSIDSDQSLMTRVDSKKSIKQTTVNLGVRPNVVCREVLFDYLLSTSIRLYDIGSQIINKIFMSRPIKRKSELDNTLIHDLEKLDKNNLLDHIDFHADKLGMNLFIDKHKVISDKQPFDSSVDYNFDYMDKYVCPVFIESQNILINKYTEIQINQSRVTGYKDTRDSAVGESMIFGYVYKNVFINKDKVFMIKEFKSINLAKIFYVKRIDTHDAAEFNIMNSKKESHVVMQNSNLDRAEIIDRDIGTIECPMLGWNYDSNNRPISFNSCMPEGEWNIGFDDLWQLLLDDDKLDYMIMPKSDFNYSQFKDIVHDENGVPYSPLSPLNVANVYVEHMINHPTNLPGEFAKDEMWVNNYYLRDIIIVGAVYLYRYFRKFAGMSAGDAVNHILDYISAYVHTSPDVNGNPGYFRALRFARWYSECIIMKYKRWMLVRNYGNWIDDFYNGNFNCDYTVSDWRYISFDNSVMIFSNNVTTTLHLTNYIDGTFSFSAFVIDGSLEVYIDGILIKTITFLDNARFTFDVPMGDHLIIFSYVGSLCKLASLVLTGARFISAYTKQQDDSKDLKGLTAGKEYLTYLMRYYMDHWKGKDKGDLRIRQRKMWII